MPALCVSNQTSRSLMAMPRHWFSSARTRRNPYVPLDLAWTCLISVVRVLRRIMVESIRRRR